jgi:hypothetical protein
VGDDGTADVEVMALLMISVVFILRITAEVLADPVKDHHGFVDRIAQHRQHRRQHRQRKLPLEEGKKSPG